MEFLLGFGTELRSTFICSVLFCSMPEKMRLDPKDGTESYFATIDMTKSAFLSKCSEPQQLENAIAAGVVQGHVIRVECVIIF